MTMEPERDIVKELEQAAEEANQTMNEVDLELARPEQLALLRQMLTQYKAEFFRLKTSARLNRLVDNKQLSDAQEAEAKKYITQITALDKEITDLARRVEG